MKRVYKILSFIFAAAILYILLIQIDYLDVLTVLRQVKLSYLFAAFGVYLLLGLVRGIRFRFLLQGKIDFLAILKIVFIHGLMINAMPSRTGELSYIYLVRKNSPIGLGSNLASLFVARIFDTLIVVFLMLLSLILAASSFINISQLLPLALIAFVLAVAVFLLFIFWETKVIWLLTLLFSLLRLNRFALGNKVLTKIQEAISSVAQVRQRRVFLTTTLLTFLVWFINFFIIWMTALGFGLNINFWQAIFIGALTTLASIIPFYTIGNFGIFEGSATLALLALGFSSAVAISFSFVVHLIGIAITIVPGIVAYVFLKNK